MSVLTTIIHLIFPSIKADWWDKDELWCTYETSIRAINIGCGKGSIIHRRCAELIIYIDWTSYFEWDTIHSNCTELWTWLQQSYIPSLWDGLRGIFIHGFASKDFKFEISISCRCDGYGSKIGKSIRHSLPHLFSPTHYSRFGFYCVLCHNQLPLTNWFLLVRRLQIICRCRMCSSLEGMYLVRLSVSIVKCYQFWMILHRCISNYWGKKNTLFFLNNNVRYLKLSVILVY